MISFLKKEVYRGSFPGTPVPSSSCSGNNKRNLSVTATPQSALNDGSPVAAPNVSNKLRRNQTMVPSKKNNNNRVNKINSQQVADAIQCVLPALKCEEVI
ncbi:hypothetical protein HHI36_014623 [Cryptolaemus montrouzieri]|uniref:Uncharacterized protein n=1 Tax=Cryptolaemus montrouzieri TaxID=559131 RepID=A0ABD2N4C5_9CUCU